MEDNRADVDLGLKTYHFLFACPLYAQINAVVMLDSIYNIAHAIAPGLSLLLLPFVFLSIVIYLHVHTILYVCTFSTPLYVYGLPCK